MNDFSSSNPNQNIKWKNVNTELEDLSEVANNFPIALLLNEIYREDNFTKNQNDAISDLVD